MVKNKALKVKTPRISAEAAFVEGIIRVIEEKRGEKGGLGPTEREIVRGLVWHVYGGVVPDKGLLKGIFDSLKNPSRLPLDLLYDKDYLDAQARCKEYLHEVRGGGLDDPEINPGSKF